HPLQVESDGLPDERAHLLLGFAHGDAAWQVRHVGPKTGRPSLDDDGVVHGYFRPACLRMLSRVPGGRSRPGLPATVTLPGLFGCLNWRWLPFVLTWRHPSCSISLMTSRTFMPQATVWPLTGYERDTRTRHGGADPRPPRTWSPPRRRRRRRPRLRRRSGAGGRVRSGLRRDGGRGDAARGGRPAAGAGGDPPRARARRVTRRYGTTFGMKPFLTLCLIALHGCAQAAAQPLRTWER